MKHIVAVKLLITIFILLSCITAATPTFAFDVLFDASNPANLGTVAVRLDPTNGNQLVIPSVPTRYKSDRLRSSVTGTVTHFLVRICTSSSTPIPVGFAVYADTGAGSSNPPGALIKRGYIASYTYSSTGWYAFPFLNNETFNVTTGTYYHLTVHLNPSDTNAVKGCRMDLKDPPASLSTNPDKWFSDCSGAVCDPQRPPSVGGEESFASQNAYQTSASWETGLLITEEEEPQAALGRCTIIDMYEPSSTVTVCASGCDYTTIQGAFDGRNLDPPYGEIVVGRNIP